MTSTALIGSCDGRPVRTDDATLLRELHDQHGHALWAYVVGLTNGDRAHAQDVVQETMLRAWRNPQVLAQTSGSARGWLFTVAKRIVIDEWRTARSRRERVTDEVPERPVADATDRAVDHHIVVAAMLSLSAEHRAVLHECYFRGSSVAEAAVALGIPAGTVKSRTHYALRALRLALDEMGGAR
ncbi:MAG TPA: sigma-70 family RNA polymerase sigma factor [Jatrophihabitans sp.]|nr:sigma-70 family RNA polymerase sigma factor [Jatrophihabitans sp.]